MSEPVHRNRSGMTLVEILITVSIIGLLAAFIIPAYNLAIRSRENSLVASQLRQAATAFSMYRMEMGSVPATRTDGTVPPEIAAYFSSLGITSWWTNSTPVGGVWGWNGGSAPAVMICNVTRPTSQMLDVDKLLDRVGDLSAGSFCKTRSGANYYYSIGQ
ncbi:MAG: type II secretion system protein [Kiritimatiellales bacterium]